MDCRQTETMLSAYHDGELSPADRARVGEHLQGCEGCSALLARLAGIDANIDVPDPGPEYWERFNRRVMDRIGNEDYEPAMAARPKRGWARRQLPYFIPAVAAAALLLVVVRQTGIDPFSRKSPPPPTQAIPRAASQAAPQATARAVPRKEPPPAASPAPAPEARRSAPPKSAGPADGTGKKMPAEPPSAAGVRMPAASGEAKERAERGIDASRRSLPSSREPEENGAAEDKADRAMSKSMAAAAPAAPPSPCETARSLAERGRLKDAESAQRACLARVNSPESQESGMVFLAELLDRQSRFVEADGVLREAQRQFPQSRPVDAYLRQRSQVQGRPIPAIR